MTRRVPKANTLRFIALLDATVVVDETISWRTANTVEYCLEHDRSTLFDYGLPLARFTLIPHGENSHYFVFTSHHASYDGWSVRQVHEMVANIYTGRRPNPISTPYKALVQYITNLDESRAYADFWRSQLNGFQGGLFPSLPTPDYRSLTDATGRSIALPGIAELVGPAITLVPVRIHWDDATTARELIRTIQDQSTAMIPHEHVAKPTIAGLDPACGLASAYVLAHRPARR
ncbi:hypothetical protein N7507_005623 [Penicillium longicatenatum]|nr:hypothetical protein N7507_005623 [Penicillium longicatenatum]